MNAPALWHGPGKVREVFCAECRTGPHSVTNRCACCDKCGLYDVHCKCGCPPRGVILSDAWLRRLRKEMDGRDTRNEGAPYWTERIGALLDHIEQIELFYNPRLPGL